MEEHISLSLTITPCSLYPGHLSPKDVDMSPSLSSVVSKFYRKRRQDTELLRESKSVAYMYPETLICIAKMKRKGNLLAVFQKELHFSLSEKKRRVSCQMNDSYLITNGTNHFYNRVTKLCNLSVFPSQPSTWCFSIPKSVQYVLSPVCQRHPVTLPYRESSCSPLRIYCVGTSLFLFVFILITLLSGTVYCRHSVLTAFLLLSLTSRKLISLTLTKYS